MLREFEILSSYGCVAPVPKYLLFGFNRKRGLSYKGFTQRLVISIDIIANGDNFCTNDKFMLSLLQQFLARFAFGIDFKLF
jgi:hypothetical protein